MSRYNRKLISRNYKPRVITPDRWLQFWSQMAPKTEPENFGEGAGTILLR